MVAPKAPVVPCAMIDTFEFLPSGSFRPKPGIRPGVIFGEPLEFSRYYGKESDRTALRAVTDEIMQQIQKLSGQEYVDVYATQAKEPQQPSAESDLLRRPS
jgi:1-acyl-sn-glycerol-3-phosphate acyltransferase